MKNSFKIGFVVLTTSTILFACDPAKNRENKNIGDTVHKAGVDTSQNAKIDTTKKDTSKK